jgi:hypothetical protein
MKTLETKSSGNPILIEEGHRVTSFLHQEFEVVVIFTQARSTLKAMKMAGHLAAGLGARIRVIVPRPGRRTDLPAQQRHFQTVAGDRKIETSLEMCSCANPSQGLPQALPAGSIVVIGGTQDRRFTFESRLARKLQAQGHHVLFCLN